MAQRPGTGKRYHLLAGAFLAFFIILTVPDHFLEEHLWHHVLKRHFLRILVWTFGALVVIHGLEEYWDVSGWIATNHVSTLGLALLVGLIPESGPHLLFVTLFASGAIPFIILIASSIVQDGHAMLPSIGRLKKSIYLGKINQSDCRYSGWYYRIVVTPIEEQQLYLSALFSGLCYKR